MNLTTKKRIDYYVGGAFLALLKPAVYVAGKILGRNHQHGPLGAILVIKLMGGGSLVLAYPALLSIRKTYPHCPLNLLTTPAVAPFAKVLGIFDHVEVIDDRSIFKLIFGFIGSLPKLWKSDTVIDLEVYSRLSAVLTTITLARNRVGFFLESVFWRRNLYTHLIFFNRFSLVTLFYERVAKLLNAPEIGFAKASGEFQKLFPKRVDPSSPRKTIAIGFACSENGRERMLTPAQWLNVAMTRLAAESSVLIQLLGGPSDRAEGDSLRAVLKASFPHFEIENRCGDLKLEESVRAIALSDEFWGVDSSLIHFARLVGTKCLSYWGPTDPATRLDAFPLPFEEVVYKKTACSPCIHVAEEPPCGGHNVCIKRLFDASAEQEAKRFIPLAENAH